MRSVRAWSSSARQSWRAWQPHLPLTSSTTTRTTLQCRSFHSTAELTANPSPSYLSSLPASSLLPLHRFSSPYSLTSALPSSCTSSWSCPCPSHSSLRSSSIMSPIDSLSIPSSLPFPLFPFPSPFLPLPLEFAVPKRKPSPRAQRHRRAGQRATNATRVHQHYRICLNCGAPVKPHFLCNRCRQVTGRF